MPKAERALESAPGVLAVKVQYPSGKATIGTSPGETVHVEEMLAALKAKVLATPSYQDAVISGDGKMAILYVKANAYSATSDPGDEYDKERLHRLRLSRIGRIVLSRSCGMIGPICL